MGTNNIRNSIRAARAAVWNVRTRPAVTTHASRTADMRHADEISAYWERIARIEREREMRAGN